MACEWREVILEDVADEITVGHVGPMASEYVSDGVPFFRSQNVEPFRINSSDLKFITREFHDRLKKSALLPGDVVIVRTGKPGACAVVPESFAEANCSDLVIVRCGPALDPRFLAYYVNSAAAHHVDSHLVGAVQQHFNVGSARKLAMRLPELQEQRAIAHILGALDAKIALNGRMNETLDQVSRALFKSWFVDFDPVRAKAEGRDTGLPKKIADVFPDRFVDTEVGEIPAGWEVHRLGQCLGLLKDGSHNPPQRVKEGVRFLAGATDVKHFGIDFAKCTYISEDDYHALHRKWSVQAGDVLLTIVGTIGNVALVTQSDLPFSLQRSIAVLRPGPMLTSSFVYCLLQSDAFQSEVECRVNPTAQPGIYLGTLGAIPVCLPAPAAVTAFDAAASAVFTKMQNTLQESRTLALLRDTLVPKLLSGEIRVKHAEAAVKVAI